MSHASVPDAGMFDADPRSDNWFIDLLTQINVLSGLICASHCMFEELCCDTSSLKVRMDKHTLDVCHLNLVIVWTRRYCINSHQKSFRSPRYVSLVDFCFSENSSSTSEFRPFGLGIAE